MAPPWPPDTSSPTSPASRRLLEELEELENEAFDELDNGRLEFVPVPAVRTTSPPTPPETKVLSPA